MSIKKRLLYCLIAGIVLGNVVFWTNRCSKPVIEKVERDTVVVYDTIPHYYPVPKDSAVVRYVTRVLPVVRDGIAQYSNRADTIDHVIDANNMTDHFRDVTQMIHDTVAVEIPITSKHYNAPEYDAWVSGFEPSLDSIKVYQRTEYITERVTINKPPNKLELDALAGIDYNITSQQYRPYAGGELIYKPNRLQVGIRGGIVKNDKAEPFVGAVVKYRLF